MLFYFFAYASHLMCAGADPVPDFLIGYGELKCCRGSNEVDTDSASAESLLMASMGKESGGHALIAIATQLPEDSLKKYPHFNERLEFAIGLTKGREVPKAFEAVVPEQYAFSWRCMLYALRFEKSRLRALQELAFSRIDTLQERAIRELARLAPDDATTWLLAADSEPSSVEKLKLLNKAVACGAFIERDRLWRQAGGDFWTGAEVAFKSEGHDHYERKGAWETFWASAEQERPLSRWHRLNDRTLEFLFTQLEERETGEEKAVIHRLMFRYAKMTVENSGQNSQLAFQGAVSLLTAQNSVIESANLAATEKAQISKEFNAFRQIVLGLVPTDIQSPELQKTIEDRVEELRAVSKAIQFPEAR